MVASLAMKAAAVWDASASTSTDAYKIVWAHHARCFAKQQIDYIMGSTGRSFVTGFGLRPPARPRHRGASCAFVLAGGDCQSTDFPSAAATYPNTLDGGLVGGPNGTDAWVDSPVDTWSGAVSLDANAALVMGTCRPRTRRRQDETARVRASIGRATAGGVTTRKVAIADAMHCQLRAGVADMMHLPSYFWDATNLCKPFPMATVDWPSVAIQPAPGVVLPDGALSEDGTLIGSGGADRRRRQRRQ